MENKKEEKQSDLKQRKMINDKDKFEIVKLTKRKIQIDDTNKVA